MRQGYVNGLHYDANALAAGKADSVDLLRAADLVRVGLAGSIRGHGMETHRGEMLPLERIDCAGQPAGCANQPGEVVNCVENHDNQTLFDTTAFKLPAGTCREDRARVQHLANAIIAFRQGIAYFHAGRNCRAASRWTATATARATGSTASTGARRTTISAPADIAWTREAFLDLLRIRARTTLLRPRTAVVLVAR